MVRNRIKVFRAEVGISASALSERMPGGVDKVAMSFIEGGRVLPTRDGLEVMCELFDCLPTDLYTRDELDLLAVRAKPEATQQPPQAKAKASAAQTGDEPDEDRISLGRPDATDRNQHEGMEQIRVWMQAEEKAALFKAVNALGYRSVAEWLREMYRETLNKYITLKLQDRKLHEAVPPTTDNQTLKG